MHFYELQTAGATSITNVEVFFSRGSHFLLQVPVHLTSLLDLCMKPCSAYQSLTMSSLSRD